jgi:uncharacterized protein (TIGR02145 family)
MRTNKLFLLVASAVLLNACRKEPIGNADGEGSIGAPRHHIAMGGTTSVTVYGQVLDEGGIPVANALVQAGYGNESALTDENGAFVLQGIRAYQRMGSVRVSKQGFFTGSRSFMPVPGGNVVRIHLLARNLAGTVQSSTGGAVELEGARIAFGTGGFTRYGQAYNGPVQVFLNYIDPTSEGVSYEMPGMLLGAKAGEAMPLVTFGMVAVELADGSGTKLDLAPGTTANVRLPMAPVQSASAAPAIDLWHYDLALGYWTFEGEANLVNGQYEADVPHFSIWNFDVPGSGSNIQGQVIDTQGNPVQGAVVRFANANGCADFQTSTAGHYGGTVINSTPLTMTVSLLCAGTPEVVHTQTVGPFPNGGVIPPVSVTSPVLSTVTGTVINCQGLPAATAYVLVNGSPIFCTNGQFSFVTCQGSATIAAADLGGVSWADPITVVIAGPNMNLGMVQACDFQVATGTVTDVDGNTYGTISFGGQEWMSSNLRTSRYRNGDPIPNVQDNMQWYNLSAGAWRHYDNNTAHEANYGKLYNHYTVSDPRNVCPAGWHVPSQADWNGLVSVLGGAEVAGAKLKEMGTLQEGTGLWNAPNYGATNQIGFSARPGGAHFTNGSFNMGNEASFWTSESVDESFSYWRMIHADSAWVSPGEHGNNVGMSIRCKRD